MKNQIHKDELPVDRELVRKLVDTQFPHFARLPLRQLAASGSSNILFCLGNELQVRLPRLSGGGASIQKEEHWTPIIGSHLPVAVPEFVESGKPDLGYSERWSIVRWLDGEHPTACDPREPSTINQSPLASEFARELATVVLAFRCIDVPKVAAADETLRGYRGRALLRHDKQLRHNVEKCRSLDNLNLDLDAALSIWEDALELPGATEVDAENWFHGDLVAENLLLSDGQLNAVLDFGELGVGDPAIDLLGAWELFDPPAREVFRVSVGVNDADWLRGRAWALAVAMMTFPYYWNSMPGRIKSRLAMAQSVLESI